MPAVILGLCGGGIAIVSARMNYFGAHVLAPGLSAETVAWGAVLSEFVKPFWLTGFFLLLRRWRPGEALMVLAMGFLVHAYSLVSVIGSSAEGRSTILSEREGKQNALAFARQIASEAKTEADRAAGIRAEAEVQADINRLLLTPDANGCLKPQGKEAKQACSQVQALRRAPPISSCHLRPLGEEMGGTRFDRDPQERQTNDLSSDPPQGRPGCPLTLKPGSAKDPGFFYGRRFRADLGSCNQNIAAGWRNGNAAVCKTRHERV